MARTIGVFRDNMERAASLEQQRRADEEARERRRLNLERLTHDFGVTTDDPPTPLGIDLSLFIGLGVAAAIAVLLALRWLWRRSLS